MEDIINKLNNANREEVYNLTKELRVDLNLASAKLLLDEIHHINDVATMSLVISLLSDIKDEKFVDVLIQKIKTVEDIQIKKELLRIVWESSLNFTPHIDYFIELLQKSDFIIAFEASTILEIMIEQLSKEQKEYLNNTISIFSNDRSFLIENILLELHNQ